MDRFAKPLAILGAVCGLRMAYSLLSSVVPYLRPSKLARYLETADGRPAWALVTGANSGIGRAFALELAARGFNVVLLGRNATKLEATRATLEARHPDRAFRVVVTQPDRCGDATAADALFAAIAGAVDDVPLNVLVNNLGGAMPRAEFGTLDAYAAAELAAHVNAMATFPTLLTGALLPALRRGGPGLVVNMGSFADDGLPYLPTYGPAKGFLMASTRGLAREMACEGRDVEVLGLRVGLVCGTALNDRPPSLFAPDARVFVRAALARVGCGRMVIGPYWPHALQMALVGLLPAFLSEAFVARELKGRMLAERAKMAKDH